MYAGGIGNYYDDVLNEKFAKVYSASGATQENFDDFQKYIIDNFYMYGLFQTVVYSVYNSKLISSDAITTFRTWVIPGSFTYVQ
jgi:hypothetical protein